MITWSEIITAIIIMCFVDNLPLIWILVLKKYKKSIIKDHSDNIENLY